MLLSHQTRGLCEPVSPMTLMGAKVTRWVGNFEGGRESRVKFSGLQCPTSVRPPSTSFGWPASPRRGRGSRHPCWGRGLTPPSQDPLWLPTQIAQVCFLVLRDNVSNQYFSLFHYILEKCTIHSIGDGDILLEWRRPATTHGRVNFYVIYYKSDQVCDP